MVMVVAMAITNRTTTVLMATVPLTAMVLLTVLLMAPLTVLRLPLRLLPLLRSKTALTPFPPKERKGDLRLATLA